MCEFFFFKGFYLKILRELLTSTSTNLNLAENSAVFNSPHIDVFKNKKILVKQFSHILQEINFFLPISYQSPFDLC